MKKIICLIFILSIFSSAQQGARYLVITHDNFYNIVQPLAQWKNRTGMKCRVVRLSETGSTADAIRNYIVNAYNTWPLRPEYLLLVGAPNLLPFPQVDGVYSDNYYTNMDGDIYNEILSGRLTVHDSLEAHTVVNKILWYERHPNTADPAWFKKGTLLVHQDNSPNDSFYWGDAHYAAGLMVANGFTRVDTFSDAYGNNVNDVIDAVNDGRAFLQYRGSAVNQWQAPFDVNPNSVTNGTKLPIVLSITCRTIGTGSTPAVAEGWLLTGTPTTPRGAAGYFAGTTNVTSGAHLRSAICRGFWNALFNEQKRTFGEACEGGRVRLYTLYPGEVHEYYGYTTLGDPDMGLWTDTPCSLTVIHPVVIPIGEASFTVIVSRAIGGNPVSNAIVCVSGKQDTMLYAVDTTDAAGNAYFIVHPQVVLDTVWVTVSGRNLKPYEGSMRVLVLDRPYVVYLRSQVRDSLGGNADGVINPGETIDLLTWVKNWGDSAGYGITGVLRTADPLINVTDSVKTIGDIAGQDSASTGAGGFIFTVSGNCPDSHLINFDLVCRDLIDSSWVSHFSKIVRSGDLIFGDVFIGGGNGNSTFEPGETISVNVVLKNIGSVGLDSIRTVIRTSSIYASIIDSLAYYPHVGPDSIAGSAPDSFWIASDSLAPIGTTITFQMSVEAGYYSDTVYFSLIVGKKAYYIWNPDPTPAPGNNMHAFLQALRYTGDLSVNLPASLDYYQSLFVCAGVYPNNRIIPANSAEAQAINNFLINRHGRVYLEGGDVWFYDPAYNNGYNFASLFGLNATIDGNPDMGPVAGNDTFFTAGMYFDYGGENVWMDHINPSAGFRIFRDVDNNYDCGVAYAAGQYRTVGVSFELGLLADGSPPSTRRALLDSIMHFFGILPGGIQEGSERLGAMPFGCSVYPTPFRDRLNILFSGSGTAALDIRIYDITGRLVRTIPVQAPGLNRNPGLYWDGTDDLGKRVSGGIYFVRLECPDGIQTRKVVYLR